MYSYSEALGIVLKRAEVFSAGLRSETIDLLDCIGRYTSLDIEAHDTNPRFDNSAMDGFAVDSVETLGASTDHPLRLPVIASIPAGGVLANSVRRGGCYEIMTGASIEGIHVDAVIKLEEVEEVRDKFGTLSEIVIKRSVKKGENIRYRGEDIKKGDTLIARGCQLAPQHLLSLAMMGENQLAVWQKPLAIVISSGDEVAPFDAENMAEQQVRNCNAPFLMAALAKYGVETEFLGVVPDTLEDIEQVFKRALAKRPLLIVTSGGVSLGKYDLIKEVFTKMGGTVNFHKAAIRPGKPILFGEFNAQSTAFFGLPGNPLAVAATTRFFIKPFLTRLYGGYREVPHVLPLSEASRKPMGLTFFQRGVRDPNGVRVLPGQASFMIDSFLKAEGWIVGESSSPLIDQGGSVEWYSLW